MSYMLPHLENGWQVDQAILNEQERVYSDSIWSRLGSSLHENG